MLPLLGTQVATLFTSLGTVIGRELQAFGRERALDEYPLALLLIAAGLYSAAW